MRLLSTMTRKQLHRLSQMKPCKIAGYDSMEAAAEDGTAFVFMGHGTSHTANVTYDQMQTQMEDLGFTRTLSSVL